MLTNDNDIISFEQLGPDIWGVLLCLEYWHGLTYLFSDFSSWCFIVMRETSTMVDRRDSSGSNVSRREEVNSLPYFFPYFKSTDEVLQY